MIFSLKLLLMSLGIGVGVQDFIQHKIYAFVIPCIAVSGSVLLYFRYGLVLTVFYSLLNLFFLALSLLIMYGVAKYKKQPFINHSMGSGDILMLAAVGVSFSTSWFLVLWLVSSLASLGIHLLFVKSKVIPYAGYLGISMAFLLLLDQFFAPSIMEYEFLS